MEDLHKISTTIEKVENEHLSNKETLTSVQEGINSNSENLDNLEERVKVISQRIGVTLQIENDNEDDTIKSINSQLDIRFPNEKKTESDSHYNLNKVDIITACLAGGIAVIIDFLIVKTPNNIKINNIRKEKSSLTALLKQIGLTEDNKAAKWVKTLEKWVHVDYDLSISESKGMYPKNHRIFSLGHDPSISGLIWGIKDIVCGTFSYIDKNGILHIDKVNEADFKKLFYAPLLWLGHLLSDMFTPAGLPIPGGCLLRTLKFGSFGEKERALSDIVEYMYVQGYDLRHLAVSSIANIVIEFIIKIYMYLIKTEIKSDIAFFEKEYDRVKNEQKKHKLLMTSYSIAACGNIAKIVAHQGNPTSINIPIMYSFVKESITNFIILSNNSDKSIKAIENRHLIDERFEYLLTISKELAKEES